MSKSKWEHLLIWSRISKNLIYILSGIIIGVFMVSEGTLNKSSKIVLIVGCFSFVMEVIIYLRFLIIKVFNMKFTKRTRGEGK